MRARFAAGGATICALLLGWAARTSVACETPGLAKRPAAKLRTPFAQAMNASMLRMDRAMMAAPVTGDPDRDFAAAMIPHHQGAIDMARAELLHGRDPVLRRLAQEIVVAQASEIDVMKRRASALPAAQVTSAPLDAPATPATNPAATVASSRPGAVPDGSTPASGDRVYSADQTSNTVSVIRPSDNRLLGVIRLGDPVPGALSALYRGQLLVHGLGYSPDHRTLAVVSIGSNSVTLIDTQTNEPRRVVYVGRSPHEAFFRPDGRELWVSVRGEDYLSVIDPAMGKEVRRVQVMNGPGMAMFRPDGRYAFVCSSFVPELDVIDTQSYGVIARVPQPSPFCPNIAVTPDGEEVWYTLKDVGKVVVIRARPPFDQLAILDSGAITNHVNFAGERGRDAYVTVGGLNHVKVYERRAGRAPVLKATIPTGDLPHGVWPSGDGSVVYVALENGGAVSAIDTRRRAVVATIPVGQTSQALVYVPGAVATGDGTARLAPLGEAARAVHLHLAGASRTDAAAKATVAINSLGLTDLIQVAVAGLRPGAAYELVASDDPARVVNGGEALLRLTANPAGAGVAQALGPLRASVQPAVDERAREPRRHLLLVASQDQRVVLVEQAQTPSR